MLILVFKPLGMPVPPAGDRGSVRVGVVRLGGHHCCRCVELKGGSKVVEFRNNLGDMLIQYVCSHPTRWSLLPRPVKGLPPRESPRPLAVSPATMIPRYQLP